MTMETLESIVLETGPDPRDCIIWLHGLGADGHDFEPIADALRLPFPVRYLFPHAPVRPVTINGGMAMRAWYDIVSPDLRHQVDRQGIRQSQALVAGLIDQQVTGGMKPERIVLAGFSQGGVIALETGVRYRPPLAGVIALSAYVALVDEFPPATDRSPPILMMHGTEDPIVPFPLARDSCRLLRELGYSVEWHAFDMPHSVSAEEVAVLRHWLVERLKQD
ncbi:MAG TPA: carboxylesterase [Methylothermaceae bacterium]|nr:carboxylesterase [Methylothermaceae bacterium]